MFFTLLADLLLALHVAVVVFVVGGQVLILAGALRSWNWIRKPFFRWGHLMCIGFIVIQSWMGNLCPLTLWEMELREKGGDTIYAGSFVAHWMEELLYVEAPAWAFATGYTLFAAVVVWSAVRVPPRKVFACDSEDKPPA